MTCCWLDVLDMEWTFVVPGVVLNSLDSREPFESCLFLESCLVCLETR